MKSRAYWEKRSLERMVSYMDSAEQVAAEIAKAYERSAQYLTEEAEKVMKTFQGLSGVSEAEARRLLKEAKPDLNILQSLKAMAEKTFDPDKRRELINRINAQAYAARIRRMEQLNQNIKEQCEALYQAELRDTTTHYKTLCEEAYLRSVFDIQQGTTLFFSFSRIPVSRVERILKTAWSGENYSERIWNNTQKLAQALKEELLIGFMTGRSYEKTATCIMERMGSGASEARRLVRTESCYVANEAEMESYEECEIEKYRFLATLDNRTSEMCRKLDNKVFLVEDRKVGVNCPPMHPWCRSTTIAEFDDDVLDGLTRRARDPKTGKTYFVPQDMDYEQWMESLKIHTKNDKVKDINLEPIEITTDSIQRIQPFACDCLDSSEQQALKNAHRRLLMSLAAKPLGTEASAVYSLDMKKLGEFMGDEAAGRVRIPDVEVPYIGIHNHPTGGTFTHTDLDLFAQRENMVMLTAVGNNGTVYAVEKVQTFDLFDFWEFRESVIAKHPTRLDSPEAYALFINDLLEKGESHGIRYYTTAAKKT